MSFFLRPEEVNVQRDRWAIVRPGSGSGIEGWILGTKIVFALEHYVRGRTIPCSQRPTCEGCNAGSYARLCAYCWILDREDLTVKILALPKSGADQLKTLIERGGLASASLKFFVKRAGLTKRSAVVLSINDSEPIPLTEAPHTPPLEAVLLRLWGLSSPG